MNTASVCILIAIVVVVSLCTKAPGQEILDEFEAVKMEAWT